MQKGRKVYDPLTNEWSTGYWIPIRNSFEQITQYVPVWRNSGERRQQNNET